MGPFEPPSVYTITANTVTSCSRLHTHARSAAKNACEPGCLGIVWEVRARVGNDHDDSMRDRERMTVSACMRADIDLIADRLYTAFIRTVTLVMYSLFVHGPLPALSELER